MAEGTRLAKIEEAISKMMAAQETQARNQQELHSTPRRRAEISTC